MKEELSGSEAVFGLLAWMSTLKTPVTVGASSDCAILAEMAERFCKTNNLTEPRDDWVKRLTHPIDDEAIDDAEQ